MMIGRMLLSVAVLVIWGWSSFFLQTISAPITARVALKQFENSDASYVVAQYGMQLFSFAGAVASIATLTILLIIWWGPLTSPRSKALARDLRKHFLGAAIVLALFGAPAANAFFDTTDRTEVITILPNESAFWIPDVGANRDAQGKLDSEEYLNANKVALKRYVIPHQKLSGSGGTSWTSGWDSYVPTGRMIIVDRTPFSREWVDAQDRGTAAKKEGFPCQTKEGLNVTVGVAIGASVAEANAAKFLYRFGVKSPAGDRSDPKVIFTSVYYGRSLAEVMDDFGRKKVSEIVCDQTTARILDKVNEDAKAIKDAATKSIVDFFAAYGINVDFVGWADTFTFDPPIQEALNRRYIAAVDQQVATMLQPYASTIQALATADALRAFGNHTDGKLPTTIVGLPPEIGSLLGSILKSGPPAAPSAAPAR